MPIGMQERSDAELVALACADDAEAFAALVERYRLLALTIALRLLKRPEEAQDAVQEAMLQAYLGLDRLRDASRFKPWFYSIVLNVCRSRRRLQRPMLLSLDGLTDQMAMLDGLDLHEVVEERELRRLVQLALQGLVPGQREVLALFYYDGLSHQEITQRLHLSLAAVKSRLHKGREQLRRQIAAAYPELESAVAPRPRKPRKPRKPRDISMTDLRIAQVQPQDPRVLVVLLDTADQRALPLWLPGPEGYPLTNFYKKRHDAAHRPAP